MRYQANPPRLCNTAADEDLRHLIAVLNICSVLILVNMVVVVAAFELG